MKRVVLHVDTLALAGFASDERAAVVRALQAELQHALAAPAIAEALQGSGQRRRVDAGEVRVGASASSDGLGRAIAATVVRSLSR